MDICKTNVCRLKILTNHQKQNYDAASKDILEHIEEDPYSFLTMSFPGMKIGIQYKLENKQQSNKWHTPQAPRQKKVRISKSTMKAMLKCFLTRRVFVSVKDSQWCLLSGSVKKIEATRNWHQLESPS